MVDNGSHMPVLANTDMLLLFETIFAKEAKNQCDC